MGYKKQSLLQLEAKGLPTLYWEDLQLNQILQGLTTFAQKTKRIAQEIKRVADRHDGYWALRTDENTRSGKTLPLMGSNRGDTYASGARHAYTISMANPEYTFVLSEAPDDSTRDANVVCWKDGDYLFGEIGFQPITLRDAWIHGKLHAFVITNGPQDIFRNRHTLQDKTQFRLDYLRRLHTIIPDDGYEYEVSIQYNSRIIVWQQLRLTENRGRLLFDLFKEVGNG